MSAGGTRGALDYPNRTFAWINDLYPKSWHCKAVKKAQAEARHAVNQSLQSTTEVRRGENDVGASASASSPGRRLRSKVTGKATGKVTSKGSGRVSRVRRSATKSKRPPKPPTVIQCGYRYEDIASHPLVLLLPYSVHSYGLVNAYSMGLPVVAPSLRLLSALHSSTGIVSHKGPSNVPWRSTPEQPIRTWLSRDGKAWHTPGPAEPNSPCCLHDPNDACTPEAAQAWLQFADWYQWPHIRYYDSPEDLMATIDALLANATLREETSAAQKAFFARELERTKGHVSISLRRAVDSAQSAKTSERTAPVPRLRP